MFWTFDAAITGGFFDDLQKHDPVTIVLEDASLSITATHDVVRSAPETDAWSSSHDIPTFKNASGLDLGDSRLI
jgi:hypothetical protein